MTGAVRAMDTVRPFLNGRAALGLLLGIAAVAVVLLAGMAGPYPALLRGWLVGFAIWSCVPIGSMTLLLIHRLTGGGWGLALAPVLQPATRLLPLVLIMFVPVLVALPSIYPWAADRGSVPHDVAAWYLAPPWFVLRAVVSLAGWSLLGLMLGAGLRSPLLAGLGLAFFGFSISSVAVDWYLSVEPAYVATAFAAMVAFQQMLAALAISAVVGPPQLASKTAGDLGALMIATLLGVVYLGYMTFVVAWYGDLPDKAEWFLRRSSSVWLTILVLALVAGALLPFGMLLMKSIRSSRSGLRIAGGLVLTGTVLHWAWLLLPAFADPATAAVAAACTLVVLSLASWMIASGFHSIVEVADAG
jgi:hypothetical protein